MADDQRRNFEELWGLIQGSIGPGCTVRNWTKDKGYIGVDFKICSVGPDFVEVDAPGAKNIQHIHKNEFAKVYNHWDAYNEGSFPRNKLKITWFSKYVISIIHQVNP